MKKWAKTVAARAFGDGPREIRPFLHFLRTIGNDHFSSVHRPERACGILANETSVPISYDPPISLAGYVFKGEMLRAGPRYDVRALAPRSSKLLMVLDDAVAVAPEGLVFCPNTRSAVEETVRLWHGPASHHPIFSAPRLAITKRVEGTSLLLASQSSEGFFHFLIETLPKLWLARNYLHLVDWFIVGGEETAWRKSWLIEAGVSEEKIVWAGSKNLRCERLLFTNYLMRDTQPDEWICSALRSLFCVSAHDTAKTNDGIWISRNEVGRRHMQWEDDVLSRVPRLRKTTLTGLSAREQVKTFSDTVFIAGAHGAGLANVVFARANTPVLEIFEEGGLAIPIYSRIQKASGGKAYYWTSENFSTTDVDRIAGAINSLLDRY